MPSSWQASWATTCASTCSEGPRPKKLPRASRFTAKPRWIATTSRNLPANCFSRLTLPMAQLKFERSVQLHGQYVRIREVVENLSAMDRPLAWTQHVTLGPPFLDPATTQFRASMTRSVVSPGGYRLQRLPHSGQRVFMANRSSPGWRAVGPASDAQDCSRQRLYRPSG